MAATYGRREVAELLLERNADVKWSNRDLCALLHTLQESSIFDRTLVRILLETRGGKPVASASQEHGSKRRSKRRKKFLR